MLRIVALLGRKAPLPARSDDLEELPQPELGDPWVPTQSCDPGALGLELHDAGADTMVSEPADLLALLS